MLLMLASDDDEACWIFEYCRILTDYNISLAFLSSSSSAASGFVIASLPLRLSRMSDLLQDQNTGTVGKVGSG